MESKSYRIREFIPTIDNRSLVVETSSGLSLGPLPGLENFVKAVTPILSIVDGVVVSPGEARKLLGRTRQEAALLMRGDWTNALRGEDFVLPPETIYYLPLLTPQEARDMGASALVMYFLLGFEEHIEANCLRTIVQFSIQGGQVGIPLIVDVQPIGERVALRPKAIELGVSYALEGGADGVVIPWCNRESLETILKMAYGTPIWIKPTTLEDSMEELSESLELGGVGLWLKEEIFAQPSPDLLLQAFRAKVHPVLSETERHPKE